MDHGRQRIDIKHATTESSLENCINSIFGMLHCYQRKA
jgi:hypothetical protein